ncbi:hypothetical protein H4R24_002342 [Coemansia sp. RSA 988]|nr:hypothetical protein H4R24_002342 [Coemansia sp. RSA 988]
MLLVRKRSWVAPTKTTDDQTAVESSYKIFKWVKTGQTVIHEEEEEEDEEEKQDTESQQQIIQNDCTSKTTESVAAPADGPNNGAALENLVEQGSVASILAEQLDRQAPETASSAVDAAAAAVEAVAAAVYGSVATKKPSAGESEELSKATTPDTMPQPTTESSAVVDGLEVLASTSSAMEMSKVPAVPPPNAENYVTEIQALPPTTDQIVTTESTSHNSPTPANGTEQGT